MKYFHYLIYTLCFSLYLPVFSNSITDYVTVTNLTSCTEVLGDYGSTFVKSDNPVAVYSFYYKGTEKLLYNEINPQETAKVPLTVNANEENFYPAVFLGFSPDPNYHTGAGFYVIPKDTEWAIVKETISMNPQPLYCNDISPCLSLIPLTLAKEKCESL